MVGSRNNVQMRCRIDVYQQSQSRPVSGDRGQGRWHDDFFTKVNGPGRYTRPLPKVCCENGWHFRILLANAHNFHSQNHTTEIRSWYMDNTWSHFSSLRWLVIAGTFINKGWWWYSPHNWGASITIYFQETHGWKSMVFLHTKKSDSSGITSCACRRATSLRLHCTKTKSFCPLGNWWARVGKRHFLYKEWALFKGTFVHFQWYMIL